MPIVYGPLVGRWGSRRLVRLGLVLMCAWLPTLAAASSVRSALALMVIEWTIVPLAVTPSLPYMAEVTSFDGVDAYGVGYGVYNTAWALGLLVGPAAGGFVFERAGLFTLLAAWSVAAIVATTLLGRVQLKSSPPKELV
jgi:predicted MFS family arabinose efflux permease